MKKLIKEIYDLKESNLVLYTILSENIKKTNYDYVKYYRKNNFIICEMKCEMLYEGKIIFRYFFDENDKLQIIKKGKQEVFNREKEIKNKMLEYEKMYKNKRKIKKITTSKKDISISNKISPL